jgi:predicted transposase/invertase (TIGR01784 family)
MVYNLAETLKKMEEDVMLAREEGIAEGKVEGKVKGRAEGIEEGILKVAKNMLSKNITLDLIVEVTGLSIEQIEKLKTESNDKIH